MAIENKGQFFVVATPIGNLSDLSQRTKQTLSSVALVAAEDTRRARQLLNHLALVKPLLRCDELVQEKAAEKVLQVLSKGSSVAFICDAGTPGVSDPGATLVDQIHLAGVQIISIPGPSALTAALSISGFQSIPFTFYGFLKRKGGGRKKILRAIALGKKTSVFFESPHRLGKTISELAAIAPSRMAFIARELTKKFEETWRGPLKELCTEILKKKILGECTIVVAPKKKHKVKHGWFEKEDE